MMAMAGEPLQVSCLHGGSGGVDRFRSAPASEPSAECKQCYLNNNTVDYVFRVNSLRNNNVAFDRSSGGTQHQTIRIRVSSIDEDDDEELNLAEQTSRLSGEEQLTRAVQGLRLQPAPTQVVVQLSEHQQAAPLTAPRSRSPSPLLEVPVEAVDISREIRRPPL